MIQGCASCVGKSLLTAALCRIIRQDGHSVAPFKSQNMALNSFVTREGLEIGRAQAVQAEAAGIEPTAAMNPILLKPTSDRKSQVVLNGRVYANLDFQDYHRLKPALRDMLADTFRSLSDEYEYVVIEGAGSPAEINLREGDIVNMGMAEIAGAPVILVGDIDKGGVFAFLAGTMALLTQEERARVKGVVINKFRGDRRILDPGIRMLEDLIRVPALGVVPWMDIDIEDEDSVTERFGRVAGTGEIAAAVVRLPHMSNYTDFNALSLEESVTLRYVSGTSDLGRPDLILLPGSKNTIEDLLYLNTSGLGEAIVRHARSGGAVIGLCGGYQMLARVLRDPHHTESSLPSIAGLGLLDMEVAFEREKITARALGEVTADRPGLLEGLAGCRVEGYEIHTGRNVPGPGAVACIGVTGRNGSPVSVTDGVRNPAGNVLGSYLHGLFDNGALRRGVINNLRRRRGLESHHGEPLSYAAFREREYDRLADIVRHSLDMDAVYRIMNGRG